MNRRLIFFVGWGLLLWLAATLFFRLVGQLLLVPGAPVLIIATFVLTVPLIAAVTYPAYAVGKLTDTGRPAAAVCVALPGMLLDVLGLAFFEMIFPNFASLSTSSDAVFGAWLLWAYGLILITGIFPRHSERLRS